MANYLYGALFGLFLVLLMLLAYRMQRYLNG